MVLPKSMEFVECGIGYSFLPSLRSYERVFSKSSVGVGRLRYIRTAEGHLGVCGCRFDLEQIHHASSVEPSWLCFHRYLQRHCLPVRRKTIHQPGQYQRTNGPMDVLRWYHMDAG